MAQAHISERSDRNRAGDIVSLILPPRYAATAQLLPPSEENDIFGLSGVLGGAVGGLSRLRSSMLGGSSASDLMAGILASRTVMENVAVRCSIAYHYGIKQAQHDRVLKQLGAMTHVSTSDEGIVRVTVEAKTRQLAANVANSYVAELDSFLRHSNISRGRSMRIFIQRRLTQVESTLAAASDSLRSFQQANRVVSVDDETQAAVNAYAQLKSQMLVKEAALAAYAGVANPANPMVANLRGEVQAFRSQLAMIERGGQQNGFGVGFGVSFGALPPVAAAFAQRYLDYRIQQEAYSALYQQYEYARILEARDAPAITILDYAVPSQRRSAPRRTMVVAVAFLFSLLLGIALAFLLEYFDWIAVERPQEHRDWVGLRDELSRIADGWRGFGRRTKG